MMRIWSLTRVLFLWPHATLRFSRYKGPNSLEFGAILHGRPVDSGRLVALSSLVTAWYLQISNHFRIYTVLYSTCRKVTPDHSQPSASIPSRIQGSSHKSRSSGLASPHLEAIAPGSWIPWIPSDDQHVMGEIVGFHGISKHQQIQISWDFMDSMGFHGLFHGISWVLTLFNQQT